MRDSCRGIPGEPIPAVSAHPRYTPLVDMYDPRMLEPGQHSPYQTFAGRYRRLLHRPLDFSAVSLLGQAVSDVLDSGCPDEDVQKVIADLEAARTNANAGELVAEWLLPLTSLLGLLNENMHNRAVGVAALNPKSPTLRDKVLAAIDAGVGTPSKIGAEVRSPTTIVSLVLGDLVDEGQIELAERKDQYQSSFRRVEVPVERSRPVVAEPDEGKRSGGPEPFHG
jgi:hypothetical protein